jgi:four helix bundle protein
VQTIPERTFQFASKIIQLSSKLPKSSLGFAISNQIIRSGTSVGANVEEAQNCSTKKEFIRTLTIALKEARETYYWVRLIRESKLIISEELDVVANENVTIIKILTTSVKKAKDKL